MDLLNGAAPAYRRRLLIDLLVFHGAAFAITWVIVGMYIWNADAATRMFGPMQLGAPAFYVAVYGPTLAAIAVTAWRYGRAGLRDLFGALLRVRVKWYWIAISLLAFPGLWLCVGLVQAAAEGSLGSFDLRPWAVALPLLLLGGHLLTDPGALGEELGWRGFVLPRLLELMDARMAALLIGVVWAVWHLPAFYVASMSQSGFEFLPFVLRVTAFSVFMTWLFVNTNGSVLWAGVVPHMMFNATPRAGIMPVGWIILVAAVVILVLAGKHLRGRRRPRPQLPQSVFLRQTAGPA